MKVIDLSDDADTDHADADHADDVYPSAPTDMGMGGDVSADEAELLYCIEGIGQPNAQPVNRHHAHVINTKRGKHHTDLHPPKYDDAFAQPAFTLGSECLESLRSIEYLLRRDSAEQQLCHLRLGNWQVVRTHLIPCIITAYHQLLALEEELSLQQQQTDADGDADDGDTIKATLSDILSEDPRCITIQKVIFQALKLLVRLTLPIPALMETPAMRMQHMQTFKQQVLDDKQFIYCLVGYMLDPLGQYIGLAASNPALALDSSCKMYLELTLTLFKNLLMISDPTTAPTEIQRMLNDRLIHVFHTSKVYDITALICQHLPLLKDPQMSVLMMEFYHALWQRDTAQDLYGANQSTVDAQAGKPSADTDASRAVNSNRQRTANALRDALMKERQQHGAARSGPTNGRHNRFTTRIAMNSMLDPEDAGGKRFAQSMSNVDQFTNDTLAFSNGRKPLQEPQRRVYLNDRIQPALIHSATALLAKPAVKPVEAAPEIDLSTADAETLEVMKLMQRTTRLNQIKTVSGYTGLVTTIFPHLRNENTDGLQLMVDDAIHFMRVITFVTGLYRNQQMPAVKQSHANAAVEQAKRNATKEAEAVKPAVATDLTSRFDASQTETDGAAPTPSTNAPASKAAPVQPPTQADSDIQLLYFQPDALKCTLQNAEIIKYLLLRVRQAREDKPVQWPVVTTAVELYCEYLSTFYDTLIYGTALWRHDIDVLCRTTLNDHETLDLLPMLIKDYTPHIHTRQHLGKLIVGSHISMKILTNLSRGGDAFKVQEKVKVRKKKKQTANLVYEEDEEQTPSTDETSKPAANGTSPHKQTDEDQLERANDYMFASKSAALTDVDADADTAQPTASSPQNSSSPMSPTLASSTIIDPSIDPYEALMNQSLDDVFADAEREAHDELQAMNQAATPNGDIASQSTPVKPAAVEQTNVSPAQQTRSAKDKSASKSESAEADPTHSSSKTSAAPNAAADEADEEEEADEPQAVRREVDFNFEKYIVRYAHPRIIQSYAVLLTHYLENSAEVNHAIVRLFARLAIERPLTAMFWQLHLFILFDQIAQDQLTRSNKAFGDLRRLIAVIMQKYFAAAQNNPVLFIEILFWKSLATAEAISGATGDHKYTKLFGNAYLQDQKERKRQAAERGEVLSDSDDDDDEGAMDTTSALLPSNHTLEVFTSDEDAELATNYGIFATQDNVVEILQSFVTQHSLAAIELRLVQLALIDGSDMKHQPKPKSAADKAKPAKLKTKKPKKVKRHQDDYAFASRSHTEDDGTLTNAVTVDQLAAMSPRSRKAARRQSRMLEQMEMEQFVDNETDGFERIRAKAAEKERRKSVAKVSEQQQQRQNVTPTEMSPLHDIQQTASSIVLAGNRPALQWLITHLQAFLKQRRYGSYDEYVLTVSDETERQDVVDKPEVKALLQQLNITTNDNNDYVIPSSAVARDIHEICRALEKVVEQSRPAIAHRNSVQLTASQLPAAADSAALLYDDDDADAGDKENTPAIDYSAKLPAVHKHRRPSQANTNDKSPAMKKIKRLSKRPSVSAPVEIDAEAPSSPVAAAAPLKKRKVIADEDEEEVNAMLLDQADELLKEDSVETIDPAIATYVETYLNSVSDFEMETIGLKAVRKVLKKQYKVEVTDGNKRQIDSVITEAFRRRVAET